MLNKWIGLGRLTRDPELRHTQNDVAVATFTLAIDRDFKSQDGNRVADFINIVAWRQSAEFVAKYFHKGDMAAVEGTLQIRSYTDKEGNDRKAAEIIASNIYFGGSKRDRSESTGGYRDNTTAYDPMNQDFEELGNEDDLPF